MPFIRMSYTNLADASAASTVAGSQSCGYCSSEARSAHRPFRTWRTPTTSTGEWILDMGSSQTVEVVGVFNANVTSVTIEGMSSSGFTAPSYTQAVTVAKNPWNWRYHHVHYPTGFGYRYLRVKIPSQSPADGATSTYYEIGGVWVGALSTAPGHFAHAPVFRVVEPKVEVGPPSRAWSQRLKLGDPRVLIDAAIRAQTKASNPADGDDLDTWLDILRRCWTADYFLLHTNLGDNAQVWVVRAGEPEWRVQAGLSEGQWSLEEAVSA